MEIIKIDQRFNINMKMVKSKAQVTIFIILAIVIIGVIGTLALLNYKTEGKTNSNISPINDFVLNCIEKTGNDAIFYIGQRGGSYKDSNLMTEDNITIYVDKGIDYSLKLEDVEKEISKYINENLEYCINDFKDFSSFSVKKNEAITKTIIEKNKVRFEVNYPLEISKDSKNYVLKKFSGVEIPARLGTIMMIVGNITVEQIKAPKDICISCLEEYAVLNDVYIDVNDYNPSELVYTITDMNSKINGQDLEFVFANRL